MNLSDGEIEEYGERLVQPFDIKRVQPSSYDLSLFEEILVPIPYRKIDLRKDKPRDFMRPVRLTDEGYELAPRQAILACTAEKVTCPDDIQARAEGKSTNGRIFMTVHVTAGFIDPGWDGRITLEIVNLGPWDITLWPGMPIAQVNFSKLGRPCKRPYGSKEIGSHYQHQMGPEAAAGERDVGK